MIAYRRESISIKKKGDIMRRAKEIGDSERGSWRGGEREG